MTPTPHGQVPEALIDLIDAYAETRHRYGRIYNARTEAARNAVIEALSGMQALSAAPPALPPYPPLPMQFACSGVFAVYSADQMRAYVDADRAARAPADSVAAPAIGDELRDALVAVSAAIADRDDRAAQKMIGEILAASPTPPAEARRRYDAAMEQAAPKAAPTPAAQAAESVPAIQGETNVQLDTDPNTAAPGQQRDVARSVALGQPMGNGQYQAAGRPSAQGDKLLTVAERNIRSFLRSAQFKCESDREAALNCVDVLWAAARDPADSVQEDAARYQWLRATTNYVTSNGKRIDVRNMPEKWDAAIDAAIAAQGGKA